MIFLLQRDGHCKFILDYLFTVSIEYSVDALLVMLFPLEPSPLHLVCNVLEPLEHIQQFLPSDDEELTFDLGDRCGVAHVSLVLLKLEDVRVPKVRALHIQIEGYIDGLTLSTLIDVYVKLDSALKDKEDLLGVIALLIQGVLRVDLHRLEQGKDH